MPTVPITIQQVFLTLDPPYAGAIADAVQRVLELPPSPVAPGPIISDFVHALEIDPGPPEGPPGQVINHFIQEIEIVTALGTSPVDPFV